MKAKKKTKKKAKKKAKKKRVARSKRKISVTEFAAREGGTNSTGPKKK